MTSNLVLVLSPGRRRSQPFASALRQVSSSAARECPGRNVDSKPATSTTAVGGAPSIHRLNVVLQCSSTRVDGTGVAPTSPSPVPSSNVAVTDSPGEVTVTDPFPASAALFTASLTAGSVIGWSSVFAGSPISHRSALYATELAWSWLSSPESRALAARASVRSTFLLRSCCSTAFDAWPANAFAVSSAAWNADSDAFWLACSPVTSLNRSDFASTANTLLRPSGSGSAGAAWMLMIGGGAGVGVVSGGVDARLSVDGGSGATGVSGSGDSSNRHSRVSSIVSQLLQAPCTASANTPRVGTVTRIGGSGATA